MALMLCSFEWPCHEAVAVVYGATPPNPRAPGGCPHGESNGDALAQNGDHAGLFQLARRWHEQRFIRRGWTWSDAYVAERNAAIAYEIWQEAGGWGPWSCQP